MAAATKTASSDEPAQIRIKIQTYFASLPPDTQMKLRKVRAAIRVAAPRATETFGYGIPGFRLDGRLLIWYAGWKQHLSFYPAGVALIRALGFDPETHGTSKGTIRFPLNEPPSGAVVKRLVKARVAELKKGKA
jgi:uncharacterized protein YdhG (YjbR/CyaY superfamily)